MFARLKTSLQGQLFLALASFTLLLCVGYTGVAVLVAYVTEDMVLESIVRYEAVAIQQQYANTGVWPAPRAAYMQVQASFALLPDELKATVQAANQRDAIKSEVFTNSGTHYHVLRLSSDTQGAYLLAEVSPFLVVRSLSKQLADFMLVLALLMMVAALFLAYRLSLGIAAPLMQLNREVKALTHTQQIPNVFSAAHFSAALRQDEIGFLARSLSESVLSLHAALQRETLFTRDLGHELRTPLTILKNALMNTSQPTDSTQQHQLLTVAVTEIENTLTTLLALARAENMRRENTTLIAGVEQAILNLEKTAQAHGLTFSLDIDEESLAQSTQVMANPRLLALLLNNLLNNALFHGGDQLMLRIRLTQYRLLIGNSIGLHASRQGNSFGHGKNLLERIALSLDCQVQFQQNLQYFEVQLDFSPVMIQN